MPSPTVIFTGIMALCAVVTTVSAGLAAYVNLKTGSMLKDYATKAELRDYATKAELTFALEKGSNA